MSKQIKQLEMDALKNAFAGVQDMVVLSSDKMDCQANTQLRAGLRKKNIHFMMVKNSLARRVFGELGIKAQTETFWVGSTVLAWGSSSLADLSKELDALLKKHSKVLRVKAAIS